MRVATALSPSLESADHARGGSLFGRLSAAF